MSCSLAITLKGARYLPRGDPVPRDSAYLLLHRLERFADLLESLHLEEEREPRREPSHGAGKVYIFEQ